MVWLDRVVLITLGLFLVIFGVLAVSNIEVLWARGIMGFSALVAGAVCLFRAASGWIQR